MSENKDKFKELEDLSFIVEDNNKNQDSNFKDKTTQNDNLAVEEENNWGKERDNLDGQHGVILEKAFFLIAVSFIYILSFLLVILIIIWFYHLVAPECYKWLSQKSVQSIERILFASTLLSLAGKYFSKYKILRKS